MRTALVQRAERCVRLNFEIQTIDSQQDFARRITKCGGSPPWPRGGRALAENPLGRASYDRLLRQGTEIRLVNDPTMRDLGVYEGFRNRVTINLPRHATDEEIASTVVHEAVHQNRYFRKIPPTTQYEEYLAFRNESLFINGARPSLNERMRIWSYVQTLYPNLAQGRHPF